MSRDDEAISVKEMCQLLHISERTAYTYLRKGVIPHRKIGNKYLIMREALLRWAGQPAEGGTQRFVKRFDFGSQAGRL